MALIVAELATPFRAQLVSALIARLQKTGKVAMIINTDRSDATAEGALRQAISYRTDAAVVLSGTRDPALADLCHRNGLKLAFINRNEERPGSARIRLDDAEAGWQALEILRQAGCSRAALATLRSGTANLKARELGFLVAAQEEGLAVIHKTLGSTSYETGLELGTALLTRWDCPNGVSCTSGLKPCGVIDAVRHRFRLPVPDDLSVIGFDDIAQAGWEAHRLTTFAQPVDAIAGACVDCLDTSPSHDRSSVLVQSSARLIWRSSVRVCQSRIEKDTGPSRKQA